MPDLLLRAPHAVPAAPACLSYYPLFFDFLVVVMVMVRRRGGACPVAHHTSARLAAMRPTRRRLLHLHAFPICFSLIYWWWW
jgi:hypothetical protein